MWCISLFINAIKDEHELGGRTTEATTTTVAK